MHSMEWRTGVSMGFGVLRSGALFLGRVGPEPCDHFPVPFIRIAAVDLRLVLGASGLRHARQALWREALINRSGHRPKQFHDVSAGSGSSQQLTDTFVPTCADLQTLQRREC